MQKPHLVVGLGATGQSVVSYLVSHHQPVCVWDTRPEPPDRAAFQHQYPDVPLFCGPVLSWPDEYFDRVIVSPGLPSEGSPFDRWSQAGRLDSDIDWFVKAAKAPIWGVTGTNGKSTSTVLLGELARAAGLNVGVGGNLGPPALSLLSDDRDLYVLELSSFQLALSKPIPLEAALFLNLSPDHLDRHGTMENYRLSKQKIYQQAKIQVYHATDPATFPDHPGAQQVPFSLKRYDPIVPLETMALKGQHQWTNVAGVMALVQATGRVPLAVQRQILQTFPGLPHRCQWVSTLNGVDWINDSKGTNVNATEAALAGFGATISGRVVWLAGGDGKGADFGSLFPVVQRWVKQGICFGKDAGRLQNELGDAAPMTVVSHLEEAVMLARQIAEPGDTVLLSPACASWDQFKNYMARGDLFMALVRDS